MSFASKILAAGVAATLGLGAAAQAAIVDPATLAADSDADIAAIGAALTSGNTDFDNWANADLLNTANPGFGSSPGATPWPHSIGSGTGGDAGIFKTANSGTSPNGGAYPGNESLYFGGYSAIGSYGGALSIRDGTALDDVQTIVFQIEYGEAGTLDFYNDVLPTLSVNGGSSLAASYFMITDQVDAGTFPVPGEGDQTVYINTYLLAWDLSAAGLNVTDPVTDFSIDFSGTMHSQVYSMRLDQSDTAIVWPTSNPNPDPVTSAVPEPASASLIALGGAALLMRRRRRSM